MVNFIKAWSLNARLFCQKIGSKHQQLLFHTAGVLVLQKLFFFFFFAFAFKSEDIYF